MPNIIKNSSGTSFPKTMVIVGYIILGISPALLFQNIFIRILFIMVSIFLSFTYEGNEIDIDKKMYKSYSYTFGFKSGKWISLENFPYITVIHNKEVTEIHSRSNLTNSKIDDFYDVYLLNENHLVKLHVKRFAVTEDAINFSKELSNLLNLNLTRYNPVLSNSSKNNRYR